MLFKISSRDILIKKVSSIRVSNEICGGFAAKVELLGDGATCCSVFISKERREF